MISTNLPAARIGQSIGERGPGQGGGFKVSRARPRRGQHQPGVRLAPGAAVETVSGIEDHQHIVGTGRLRPLRSAPADITPLWPAFPLRVSNYPVTVSVCRSRFVRMPTARLRNGRRTTT
jgi:hypothetical protein